MNISIRRQGILIRNIAVTTDTLRIGSGDDCEVQLADPFLSPLVAKMVLHNGEWRFIDAGMNLEGIRKNGVRISDEAVEPGQTYAVGAFELLSDANGPRTASSRTDEAIPMTMISSALGEIPGTMIQRAGAPAGGVSGGKEKLRFEPIAAQPAVAVPAYAPSARDAPSRLRMIGAIAAVAVLTIVAGILVIFVTAPKRSRRAAAPAAPTASLVSAKVLVAHPAVLPDGSALARDLQVDQAIAAWEAAIAAGRADAGAKQRIVNGALQLGRAYAAVNDSAAARRYFEKVIRYADPESEAARYARSRLAS